MDMLTLGDERLAGPVHGVLPAAQAAKVIRLPRCFGSACAQSVAASLGPDEALRIGRLELAVDTEKGTVGVDVDLGIEERVALGRPFGDAEADGCACAAAGSLDLLDLVAVLDHDALIGVQGQGTDLGQWRVAFDPVLFRFRR